MKMKKWIAVGLAAGMSLSMFAGCQKNDSETNSSDATNSTLKDGTWTAEAEKFDDHGWKPNISIQVAEGKITEVA
ncbi:MAG: FMN-binding protein, partial [Epulopiscium sp.]|nr:FMN-binding protein [Candidatus Epulonipiscium sp.]